ncbi:MAG: PepSY domain-containing protein [Lautropia sp.]|nr:PepSY domain-containing protein [Lautropia sp.]
MQVRTFTAGLVAVAGLAVAGLAHAVDEDVVNLGKAKVSLTEAIAAAEKHHAGSKAARAEVEVKDGKVVFDIEVVTDDKKVFDVMVDAADGKVLGSKEDTDG